MTEKSVDTAEAGRCELTPYSDLAEILELLPVLVRERRRVRRLSLRAAAEEMDIAASTLTRFEGREGINAGNLINMLRWLDKA